MAPSVDDVDRTMYTYIVERTQIYLSREQAAALDREARRRGTTRSHLIREAIEEAYVVDPDRQRVLDGLRASAGAWKGRTEGGEAYVEGLRTGERLSGIWGPETTAE
jgi:predicted transcriptional regulator